MTANGRVSLVLLALSLGLSLSSALLAAPPKPKPAVAAPAPAPAPTPPPAEAPASIDAGAEETPAPRAPSESASAAPSSPPPQSTPPSKGRGLTDNVPCSACHTTEAWRAKGKAPGDTGGFDHATTGFPLTGQHARAACVSCHDGKRKIKRDCSSCHTDAHSGRLSQSCDQCHVPQGFRVTKPLEIHRFTRFPLTGMHVLADCTQCHRRAADHQWTGAPIDCFACHERDYRRADLHPVHVGTATSPSFPRDCSQCHRAIGWAPAKFDPAALGGRVAAALQAAPPGHDLRFPIGFGSHRMATCSDCHAQLAVPRIVRCTGCHAHDPVRLTQQHKRQPLPASAVASGSSCLSCHPGGARR